MEHNAPYLCIAKHVAVLVRGDGYWGCSKLKITMITTLHNNIDSANMKTGWKIHMTIKKQLLYTIILSTLIPMIVIPWIGYLYIRDTVKEQLLLQSKRQLEEITRDTEDMLDDILKVSSVAAVDENIMEIIKEKDSSIQKKSEVIAALSNMNAVYLYRYNAAICLYDNYGRIYSTLGTEQNEKAEFRKEWNKETIINQTYFLWKVFPERTSEEPVLGMSRNLYDRNGKRIGTLCIEIYQDRYLTKLLRQDSDLNDTERYLVDEEGNLVLKYTNDNTETDSSQKSQTFTREVYSRLMQGSESGEDIQDLHMGNKRFIFLQNSVEKTGWKLIQIVPYNEVFAKLNYYRDFTYLSNLICLALLILVDNYTANKIGKSLTRLGAAMKQVRKGNFITIENKEKNIEVHQIYDDFNNMSTKLNVLFEENRRITREKEECRLLALQTQIQPHFLFNTLNGIKWLCIIESAPTAERMIESLGHILEYSLGKTKDCVTLEEELTCLKHYVELQKMRYGNIFDVFYEMDEKLLKLEVPVLILQPLVENSIIHGIREKEDRGEIWIRARQTDDEAVISVEDNGEGISEERICEILNGNGTTGNIGVVNVKERMELYYRDSRFEIVSEEGRGTRIQMILKIGEEML